MKPIISARLRKLAALLSGPLRVLPPVGRLVGQAITLSMFLAAHVVIAADDNTTVPEGDTDESSAETEEASAPIIPLRAVPYPDAERHESLIEYMALHQRSQEVVTLIGANDSFYGLFLREETGSPQGGALILHDLGQHGHWPELVAPLRQDLPEYGWTTLAIELPAVPVERLPPRKPTPPPAAPDETNEGADQAPEEADSEQTAKDTSDATQEITGSDDVDITGTEKAASKEQDTTETDTPGTDAGLSGEEKREAYAEEITAHLQAGLEYLGSRGQLNSVLIAHGDSAVWAALAVQRRQADTENARGMALIMVDAREHPLSALRLTQVLETLEIPVLDILTADSRSTHWEDKQRLGAMKRRHRDTYQQIRLSSASADSTSVLRRIRGWLKTHAAGTELP